MHQPYGPALSSGDISVSGSVTGQNVAIGHGARIIQVIQQVVEGMPLLSNDYTTRIEHFFREYLGTEEHPTPFGGRTDELHLLDRWLQAQETPPYLLLAAPAGRGKSALLVQWHARLLTRSELAITFFPISVRFRTNLAGVVFPTLASRLAAFHGEQLTITPNTPHEVWREFLAAYLARPLPDGRQHLLLLDGLDEAADWEVNADLFPSKPPPGLRVLVSARYLAGDSDTTPWLCRLGWEKPGRAQAIDLGPLSQEGVADVLHQFAQPPDQENLGTAIARELHRLSEGDPLLVRLYLDHLQEQHTELVRLQPTDLHAIDPGLAGYFDRWWQDQRRLWGQQAPLREPAVQTVLTLLACALGPLSQEALLSLAPPKSGLSTWLLEETLLPLQRFVLGDGRQQGYTLSHPRLGQYFYEQLSRHERAAAEERFLSWGQQALSALNRGQLPPEDIPHYLTQYYGAHLVRAGANADVLLALVSHSWQRAWEAMEGTYAGFLDDTARAWKAAEQADAAAIEAGQPATYLGSEARCALCRASINSMAKHLPGELLLALVREGLWTPMQGAAYARQIPDARQRAKVLVDLTLQVEGPLQAALAHEALDIVQTVSNQVRQAGLLVQLLPCLPRDTQQQQLNRMLDAARANNSLTDRAQTLLALMPVLSERLKEQMIQEILETALEIPHAFHRARTLAALAAFVPEVARGSILQVTLEAIGKIDNEDHQSQVMATLAPTIPEQFKRELLLMTRAMQGQVNRTRVLVALAPTLSDEMKQQVLVAIQGIRGREDRLPLLSALIPALPADLLQQVLELGTTIAYSAVRARLLSALAPHLPPPLMPLAWQLAWEAAKEITHEANRARTMASLAPNLPDALRKQGLSEALQAVRAIWDTSNRVQSMVELAPALPEVALLELLNMVQTLSSKEERLEFLVRLAPQFSADLKQQVLPTALADILTIQGKEERIHLLASLAPALLVQLIEELFVHAQGIRDEASRTTLFMALAPVLPDTHKQDLLHATKTLKHEINRAHVLVTLASVLPEELKPAGLKAALRAIKAVKNEMGQASLLAKLAPTVPEDLHEQMLREALEQALALKMESYRAQVLTVLAPVVPMSLQQQVYESAQAIAYAPDRARVLGALVPVAPQTLKQDVLQEMLAAASTLKEEGGQLELLAGLAPYLPDSLIKQVLASILSMKQEGKRVELLLALAPSLPDVLLEQVLPAIQALSNETKRTEAIAALAPHLVRLPARALYAFWREILHAGACRTRRSLLADLSALIPLMIALGGQAVAVETFQAIRDIGQWWP